MNNVGDEHGRDDGDIERRRAREPALAGPKRQHYLPQFYLNGFLREDNCIAVFDREQNELRRQQPLNTGVQGHLYTLRDEQGRQRFELEGELARIEGTASQILPKLLHGADLGPQERADFATFVALFAVRTPAFIESVKVMNGDLIRKFAHMTFSDMDRVKQIIRSKPDGAGLTEEALEIEARKMIEFAHGDQYEVTTDHVWAVQLAIPLAERIAPILFHRQWQVLRSEPGRCFVTSDIPVQLTTVGRRENNFWGVGFGNADALVLMPLDSNHLLAMHGNGGGTISRDIEESYIRRVNMLMCASSQRFVIGRDDELILSLVRASGIVGRRWRPFFSGG